MYIILHMDIISKMSSNRYSCLRNVDVLIDLNIVGSYEHR